jgi:hypothetical protein
MAESREDRARRAGWRPHPLLTEQARSTQWAVPQLHLRVWATYNLITTLAYVEWMGDDGRLVHHGVARATWEPPARPTERQVVEWGYRALGKWLADELPVE